jgi:hypothetical protein
MLGALLTGAGCANAVKSSPVGELTPEQRAALLITDAEPNLGQGSAQAVVEEVRVYRSSGEPQVDTLATRVALRAHFAPASNDRVPIGVWNELPITVRKPSFPRAAGRDTLPPIPE